MKTPVSRMVSLLPLLFLATPALAGDSVSNSTASDQESHEIKLTKGEIDVHQDTFRLSGGLFTRTGGTGAESGQNYSASGHSYWALIKDKENDTALSGF